MGFFDLFKSKPKSNTPQSSTSQNSTPQSNTPQIRIPQGSTPQPKADLPKIVGRWYNLSDIKSMTMGGNLGIVPCDATAVFEKSFALMLNLLGNTPKIRRSVHGADFSTEDKALKYLTDIIVKTEAGYQFSYCIQQGSGILGMINIYTPDASKMYMGFPEWTTDFFIIEVAEGQGLMKAAMLRALYQLQKSIHVPKLYALVDPANTRCINLLSSLPFDLEDNTGFSSSTSDGTIPKMYSCNLETIRFERE